MNRLCKWILFCCVGILVAAPAWGGNKKMVEQQVEELDRLNRSVVRQIPDLPKNGKVKIKAQVAPDGKAKILESEVVTPESSQKSSPVLKEEELPSVKSAIVRLVRGEARIRPYLDDNSEGAYPRMRDALAANFGRGRM